MRQFSIIVPADEPNGFPAYTPFGLDETSRWTCNDGETEDEVIERLAIVAAGIDLANRMPVGTSCVMSRESASVWQVAKRPALADVDDDPAPTGTHLTVTVGDEADAGETLTGTAETPEGEPDVEVDEAQPVTDEG